MTTRYLTRLVLAYVCIVFCACRKSSVNTTDPIPPNGLLASITYSDGAYDSLYYRADGKLAKVIDHINFPQPYDEIYIFTYDQNNKVVRITDNHNEHYDYAYNGQQLIAVSHYVGDIKYDYKFYTYTNDKLAIVEEYYRLGITTPAFTQTSQKEVQYYPDGNLKEEINYTFDTQTHLPVKSFSVLYSDYDSKNNTLDHVQRFLYFSQIRMAANNARKIVNRDDVNGTDTEFQMAFTYNDSGNPLTRKMTYATGTGTTTETALFHYY